MKIRFAISIFIASLLALHSVSTDGQDTGASAVQYDKPWSLGKTTSSSIDRLWFSSQGSLISVQFGRIPGASDPSASVSISVWKKPPDDSEQLPAITIPDLVVPPAFNDDATQIAFVDDAKHKLIIQHTADQTIRQEVQLDPTRTRNKFKLTQLAFIGKGDCALAILFDDGDLQIYNTNPLDRLDYTWVDLKGQKTPGSPVKLWASPSFLFLGSYADKKVFRFRLQDNGNFAVQPAAAANDAKPTTRSPAIARDESIGLSEPIFALNKTGTAIFSSTRTQLSIWNPGSKQPENLKNVSPDLRQISIDDNGDYVEIGDAISQCSTSDGSGSNECRLVKMETDGGFAGKVSNFSVKGAKTAFLIDDNIYYATRSNSALPVVPATDQNAADASELFEKILSNYLPILLSFISICLIVILLYVHNLRYGKSPWTRLKEWRRRGIIIDPHTNQPVPVPEVPEELVTACVQGDCVLFVGAGVSANSGYPLWTEFVHELIVWAKERDFIDKETANAYHEETDQGNSNLIADNIYSKVEEDAKLGYLHLFLKSRFESGSRPPSNFISPFSGKREPNSIHLLLKKIPFSGVLTTNFDNLLDLTYGVTEPLTYQDTERLLTCITTKIFFLLKLYGDLRNPETVLVAPAQFEESIGNNKGFSQAMETLFRSRTILFVGSSLDGIETYLKTVSLSTGFKQKHFALVHVDDNSWIAKAYFLKRRYGITVLPFTSNGSFGEIEKFLSDLLEQNDDSADVFAPSSLELARLQGIQLTNIGPFDELDIKFDSRWNLLLGDNGVGKSTVLKAIAIALCGEKSSQVAGRLVKLKSYPPKPLSGSPSGRQKYSGSIKLLTDKNISYITEIVVDAETEECTITSNTAQPMDAEGWLAIGFPPLRSIGWKKVDGPSDEPLNKKRPVAEDLLPILTGEPDPRLDKLKKWIVTLDYERTRLELAKASGGERVQRLIEKVFEFINAMIAPTKVIYRGIDANKRIKIETADGPIPLEAVSQGMASLIGWTGVLMQRMYEIYEADENPLERYALVLVDEIDAHMHPQWQQHLIPRLKQFFPRAQFVISTHSPLIVAGLSRNEIIRFARNEEGKVETRKIAADMSIGYLDQILTSELFGLSSTLDVETQLQVERYRILGAKEPKTEDERDEYEEIIRSLMFRVPALSGSYEQKRDDALETAKLMTKIGARVNELSPGDGTLMVDRGTSLLEKIEGTEK